MGGMLGEQIASDKKKNHQIKLRALMHSGNVGTLTRLGLGNDQTILRS